LTSSIDSTERSVIQLFNYLIFRCSLLDVGIKSHVSLSRIPA
jgi:hypothetical protein